jgi:hypothetical protein
MPDDFERLNWALDRILGCSTALVCEECSASATGAARGWRTYLSIDDQVATYCPECAGEQLEPS